MSPRSHTSKLLYPAIVLLLAGCTRTPQPAPASPVVRQQTAKPEWHDYDHASIDCGDGYSFHHACPSPLGTEIERAQEYGVRLSDGRCVACGSDAYAESYPLSRAKGIPLRFDDPLPPSVEARRLPDGSYIDKYGHSWKHGPEDKYGHPWKRGPDQ